MGRQLPSCNPSLGIFPLKSIFTPLGCILSPEIDRISALYNCIVSHSRMKFRAIRSLPFQRAAKSTQNTASFCATIRAASSISQRPNSDYVSFPGALKSAFTSSLNFEHPESYTALPTYRVVDQNGTVVDQSFTPDISDETIVKLYKDMLYISIMDLIMYDAQRQGRLSFYMVSAGEEAVSVGSSSVLDPEDPVYCQYREQGFFKERGMTTKEFMSQLFANKNDPGKGRNMPVHYGSKRLNIVRASFSSRRAGNCLEIITSRLTD